MEIPVEVKVLLNPLIVAEIFKYSSPGLLDGRILRQVCRLWNDSVLTSPRVMIQLHGHHVYPYPGTRFGPGYLDVHKTFDPRLSRSLKISAEAILEAGVKQFDALIVNLELSLQMPEMIPRLEKVFQSKLPNLKSLTLENSQIVLDSSELSLSSLAEEMSAPLRAPVSPLPLPSRPALKEMTVKFLYKRASHQFLQQLIDSAPNLHTLQIIPRIGNVYPDLSEKKELRSLLYSADLGTGLYGVSNLNARNVTKMLSQVAEWLERLELDAVGKLTNNHYMSSEFEMPIMPKLVYFCNKRLDIFPCSIWNDISGRRLPSVKKLIFPYQKFTPSDSWKDMMLGLCVFGVRGFFTTVKELWLPVFPGLEGCGSFTENLDKLKTSCANLEKLTVELAPTVRPGLDIPQWGPPTDMIPKVLNAAKSLGLKYLEIYILFSIQFSQVVQLLSENCTGLEDLQKLTIHFTSELGNEDVNGPIPTEHLVEPLKTLSGMKRVEFSGFKVSRRSKLSQQMIINLASEYKLPICFLN